MTSSSHWQMWAASPAGVGGWVLRTSGLPMFGSRHISSTIVSVVVNNLWKHLVVVVGKYSMRWRRFPQKCGVSGRASGRLTCGKCGSHSTAILWTQMGSIVLAVGSRSGRCTVWGTGGDDDGCISQEWRLLFRSRRCVVSGRASGRLWFNKFL